MPGSTALMQVNTANPSAGKPPGCTVRGLVSMAREWPVLIEDSEDGVIGCYPLAVCEGRYGADADVRSSSGRETDVLLDDGRSTFDGHLFELHVAPPTPNDL